MTDYEAVINPVVAGLGFPVDWPNVPFDPTINFLRVNYLESQTERTAYGCDRLPFLLQIDVVVTDGAGMVEAQPMIDAVRNEFKTGKIIPMAGTRLEVERSPYLGPRINDKGWYFIPISIPFEVYVEAN